MSSNPAAAEPPPDGEIVAATVPAQPSWWTAESSSAAADGTAADDLVHLLGLHVEAGSGRDERKSDGENAHFVGLRNERAECARSPLIAEMVPLSN